MAKTEEQKLRHKYNQIHKIEIYERKARKMARLIMLMGCDVCPAKRYCENKSESNIDVKNFNNCKKYIVEWMQEGSY